MKRSAAVAILAGEEIAAQEIETLAKQLGHEVVASGDSVDAILRQAEQGAACTRPALVLIELAQACRPAAAEAIAGLLRRLDVPAVYVARHAGDLARLRPASPGAGQDMGPAEGVPARWPGRWDDIACLLDAEELSLAISLALRRSPRRNRTAHATAQDPATVQPPRTGRTADSAVEDSGPYVTAEIRAMFDALDEGFCTLDSQWRYTYVNQRIVDLTGRGRRTLIGRSIWEVPPLAGEDWGCNELQRVAAERAPMHCESYHRLHDAWFEVSAYPSEHGISLLVRDITKRKQAEEALRKSEERYASLFHLSAVPLWERDLADLQQAIVDLQAEGVTDFRAYLAEHPQRTTELRRRGRLIDINEEALKLFGAESREEMEQSFEKLYLPESHAAIAEIMIAIAEGRSDMEYENVFGTLHGERLSLLFRVALPSRERKLENMLVSCVDITARKRAEEQITQLNADLSRRAAELEAANTELESFSYSVSHDLRAPLRAIDGFGRMLMEDFAETLDERGMGYLQRMRKASQRMARLIDDLLSLSRMTRSPMHIEPCDLSAMARSIARELHKSQPDRQVEVVIQPDIRVQADPNLLHVVLENLLGNAWKFTSRQPRARVELGTVVRDGRTAYFVRDDGAGFDMAFADKLFSPFQRLHSASDFEGSGIGLATVKRIIHRHGGEIWAQGQSEGGATFTFTLS